MSKVTSSKRLKFIVAHFIFIATVQFAFAQPANDLCENAIVISLGAGQSFNSAQAGLDGPEHASAACFSFGDNQVNNDIWYSFTADFDGYVEWSACGTADFDTRMAVYAANAICPLEDADLLACNDDGGGCADFTSYLIFPVNNGSTYLLRLGGYANGDTGSGTFDLLEITPPPAPESDLCENPVTVSVISESEANNGLGWVNGTTIGASLSGEIPACAINGAGEFQDVWYNFNSGMESTLEIRLESLSAEAQFGLDFFQACGTPVDDTNNGGGFYQQCYSQADIDVFTSGIIEIGELEPDTDYLMRISSQITYYPAGDFRFQIVATSSNSLVEPEATAIGVYPNPAKDAITVIAPSSFSGGITIRDMSGRIVKAISGSTQTNLFQIDISDLKGGIYFIELAGYQGNQGVATRVVIL